MKVYIMDYGYDPAQIEYETSSLLEAEEYIKNYDRGADFAAAVRIPRIPSFQEDTEDSYLRIGETVLVVKQTGRSMTFSSVTIGDKPYTRLLDIGPGFGCGPQYAEGHHSAVVLSMCAALSMMMMEEKES